VCFVFSDRKSSFPFFTPHLESEIDFPIPAAKIAGPPPALIENAVRPFSAAATPRRFFGRRANASRSLP
jgi:hypothetical protein